MLHVIYICEICQNFMNVYLSTVLQDFYTFVQNLMPNSTIILYSAVEFPLQHQYYLQLTCYHSVPSSVMQFVSEVDETGTVNLFTVTNQFPDRHKTCKNCVFIFLRTLQDYIRCKCLKFTQKEIC